jgi:hypothetical protein
MASSARRPDHKSISCARKTCKWQSQYTYGIYEVADQRTYLGAVIQLPCDDGNNEDWDANIRGNKIGCLPVTLEEDRESSNESNDDGTNTAEPGGVGLPRCLPWEGITVDALNLHGAIEAEVAEAECSPCDEACDCAEVEKPGECLSSTTRTKT